MRTLTLLAAFPVALAGVLVAGGAAYADAPGCTVSSSDPTTTTCTSSSTVYGWTSPLTAHSQGFPAPLTDLVTQYCEQQLPGITIEGWETTGATFKTQSTVTSTTVYRGRSTKAGGRNAITTTASTAAALVQPLTPADPLSITCHIGQG